MEIRRYWLLFRKWLWLILLGGVIGGLAAFLYARTLPVTYRATTRIMVSRVSNPDIADFYAIYGDMQLAKNYQNLIETGPILETLSGVLGYPVSNGQIEVKLVPDSSLLDISVRDANAQRTAEIANNLVTVFVNYNEQLQASRYETSEETFQNQISQVEAQISRLQEEMVQSNITNEQQLQEEFQQQIVELQEQLDATEAEIINVEAALGLFFPTPMPTSTPETSFSSTATPVPTPTLSNAAMINYKETQNRLDKLQTLRDLYKNAYTNALVLGSGNEQESIQSEQDRRDQIQTSLLLYQQIYTSLLNNYETVRLSRLQDTTNVTQIEPAVVPSNPSRSDPVRLTVIGIVIGVMLIGGVVVVKEYMDDTLKTPEDVEYYLNTSIIGMVREFKAPHDGHEGEELSGVFTADYPLSIVTEDFRSLITKLELIETEKPIHSIMVTSANPSEGKSTIALNLAVVLAQRDKRVILVDSDLRRPVLHSFLGVENRDGLSEVLRSKSDLQDVIQTWGDPPIRFIPSGSIPMNPPKLLSSQQMDAFLYSMNSDPDYVILDTSPALVSDPIALSAKVDGVLIIVEPGKTKIGMAQALVEQLQDAGANLLGVILNPISRDYSYYYTKYGYYYSRKYYKDEYGYGYGQSKDQ